MPINKPMKLMVKITYPNPSKISHHTYTPKWTSVSNCVCIIIQFTTTMIFVYYHTTGLMLGLLISGSVVFISGFSYRAFDSN